MGSGEVSIYHTPISTTDRSNTKGSYLKDNNKWTLTDHHYGFKKPGRSIPKSTSGENQLRLSRPAMLEPGNNLQGKIITLKTIKEQVIPARNMWLNESAHKQIAEKSSVKWLNEVVNKRTAAVRR